MFEVTLQANPEQVETLDFTMAAPVEIPDSSDDLMSDAEREANDARVQRGTAIRTAFETGFWNEEQSNTLADELGLPQDRVWAVLKNARGNSPEIAKFLQQQTPIHGEYALKLLESLRPKDPQDTMIPTLEDHLNGSAAFRDQIEDDELFVKYVQCPRVHFEMIGPYRAFFQAEIAEADRAIYAQYPQALVDRLAEEIEVLSDQDRYQGMATPVGAFQLKHVDRVSRNICFVAIARSIGIPARLEPLNARPQYWYAGQWNDANFEADASAAVSKASTG
ncbi:transglutaminase domain-containing protein, partial [Clostridium perfringens]|nr:transglutaminase domain-containing protein [Clostridium perfringens]